MDKEQNTDQICDIKLNAITIAEHNCNINRAENELYILANFSDVMPKFTEEIGSHFEIITKNGNKTVVVPLNNSVTNGMLIKNFKNMTDEEYYRAFIEQKKPVVENLIKNTYAKGFELPSVVQAISIPELIQRKDALIQFKSGTGKTHAFLFGLLWGFDPLDPVLQYIFITNSHEVAKQIYKQSIELLPDAKISLCIGQKKETNVKGGFKTPISTSSLNTKPKSIREEITEVAHAQIIVCTMGKFYDYLCNKKCINNIDYIKAICVDEFDNIVASRSKPRNSSIMSTEEQIAAIIKKMPKNTQRVFFSATVTEQSLQIAHSYFRPYSPSIGEPFIVLLDIEDYTLEGIRQYYVEVNSIEMKKEVLIDLLNQLRIAQGIIFTNQIHTAVEIKYMLDKQTVPFSSAVFHGELPAGERDRIHKDFLENKIRILISTDLTARGFDAQSINIVINYDMPDTLETYIHRVGRSGRYGRKGVAISLIMSSRNHNEMKKVEKINEVSKTNKLDTLPENLADLL